MLQLVSTSNHSQSVNAKLLKSIAHLIGERQAWEWVDFRDYDLPMLSIDLEKSEGIPELATSLFDKLQEAQGYIFALPEHNGNFAAFTKNHIDWLTRVNLKFLGDKPVFLVSATPGPNGGVAVLATAEKSFGFFGAESVDTFRLPQYSKNFSLDDENLAITDSELKAQLTSKIDTFLGAL